jgi:plasmid stabilization system protein ParE
MRVRVTDDAADDLRQIEAFISEDDAVAADRVIERVRKTTALLAILPRTGHDGIVPGTFEKDVPHVVAFRVDANNGSRELVDFASIIPHKIDRFG